MAVKKRLFNLLSALITFFVIGIFVMSIILKNSVESLLTTDVRFYSYLLAFIGSALLEFIPQFIAPHFILLNNAFIGLTGILSLIIVTLGSAFGSYIGFLVGRKHGFAFARSLYGVKKIKYVEKGINARGKWIVTIAALTPLPYIPLIFGSLGMRRRTFIYYGMIPRAISFIVVWIIILLGFNIPLL